MGGWLPDEVVAMAIGWMWLVLGLAWLVNLLLFLWTLRLRLEVWANRRVIAALEAAAHVSEQKGYSNRTNGVSFVFLLPFYLILVV